MPKRRREAEQVETLKKKKTTPRKTSAAGSTRSSAALASSPTVPDMPPAYSTAQKSAINTFAQFTSADRSTCVRFLKSHNWNVDQAVEAFFAGGGGKSAPTASKNQLNKLFDNYRDEPRQSPDNIGVSGMMSYLEALGVAPDDVGMLIVSEIVRSPSMGEITRQGFVDGWETSDTIEKQRSTILQRRSNLSNPSQRATFKSVYKHTFPLARQPGQKAVQLDAAIEYWRLLFRAPSLEWCTLSTPWLDWWIEFLQRQWKKSVNKDMWEQTLAFAEKTIEDDTLAWWDENAAWPSVVDEFVEWIADKRASKGEEMDVE